MLVVVVPYVLNTLRTLVHSKLPWPTVHGRCKTAATAAVVVFGAFYTIKIIKGWRLNAHYRRKRFRRQEERRKALQKLAVDSRNTTISEAKRDEICHLSLQELTNKLQSGELSAIDTLRAYQQKALDANVKTNAITEPVCEAESIALECDQRQDKSRPLHGVPISIKENFPMKGYDCVLGLSYWIDRPFSDDCVLVKVLKHQGAVPFVRTNVPQTMISYDTTNPVFGQTFNPHGTGRSAGGSSGGEAALIAAGGSLLGLGGDIGGSIRIPCSMCGICGFKPTGMRVSRKNTHVIFQGQNVVAPAYGPMSKDVDSLVQMMRALLCPYHFELDKTVPPLPFNEKEYTDTRKLRIGFYLEDGFMISTPPMQRAVKLAVEALKSCGHEVVEWNYPSIGRFGAQYWGKAIFSDGGKELLDWLRHDDTDHGFLFIKKMLSMPKFLNRIICFLAQYIYPRMAATLPGLRGMHSIIDFQQLVRDVKAFKANVEDDLAKNNIDAFIAPAFTMPAPPVGMHQFASGAASYTTLLNVLDFPAGTLPVTSVTSQDTANMSNYPTPDLWHRAIKKMMVGAEGLPVGVQVASLPWREERCLRVMKELETSIGH